MRKRRPVVRRGRLYFTRVGGDLMISVAAREAPGGARLVGWAILTSTPGRFAVFLAPVTISLPLVDRSIALRILRNLKREALCERS